MDDRGGWREHLLFPDRDPFVWGLTVGDINRDDAPDIVMAIGTVAEPYRTRRPRGATLATLPGTVAVTDPQLQAWINTRRAR